PLLMDNQLVKPTEEDLARQVPAQFAAQGALDGDGLKRKFLTPGWYVAAAPLAGDHEVPTLDDWEAECHSLSIGEYKTKVIHRQGRRWTSTLLLFARQCGDTQLGKLRLNPPKRTHFSTH
ncbi:MAG: hypothetical protein ACP5EP_13220, partial [Acidobacteriaceae bacterium]